MTVLVTGGTGFLGTHTVAAALRSGHRVRVLARDPVAAERALTPLEADPERLELMIGDVTDETAVARAVRGAQYLIHAASVYSFDSRRRADIRRINERGTEVTLAAARRAGVSRTVYVSTFGALLPAVGGLVGPESPPGTAKETYLAAKAAAERVARRHQAEDSSVVIVYAPGLLGPDDPRTGDQVLRLRAVLRGLMPVWPGGGFPIGDVRDTAQLLALLLRTPAGAGDRFFGPGRYVSTRNYLDVVREVTGRSLPTVFLPARAMLPAAALVDVIQRVWPWHIPAEYGACYVCACDARVKPMPPALGLAPRPFGDTVGDAVRWLHRTGLVSARQAGLAALTGPVPVQPPATRAVP